MKFEILGPSNNVVNVVETEANPIRIGKNASCELCLDDASVSRVHAVIELTPQGYRLSDRISVGGTFLNDQRVESSKPAMISSGAVLRFGNVSVRVVFDEVAEEEAAGATLAVNAPDLETMASQDAAPAVETAPRPSLSMAPAVAAGGVAAGVAATAPKPGGFAGGGFTAGSSNANAPVTIIRKKKRGVSFERRFMSNRGKSNSCVLEVAFVWRDNVISIDQYEAKNGNTVSVGTDKKCSYQLNTGMNSQNLVLAKCIGSKWQLCFNTSFKGCIVQGDSKRPFSECSTSEFSVPTTSSMVPPGSLSCEVTGDVRAKYEFGEAVIMIRYVDKAVVAVPFLAGFEWSKYGNWVASFLIHAALFSVILFATDRVDALMVDRIMTASKFATVIETQVEEEEEADKPDEEEPEEQEVEDETDVARDAADTPFAANTTNNSAAGGPGTGSGMSKGEANAAAQATGLLAQSNAMNSMLAAGMDMNSFDNLDWSSFDSSAQAASAGYGLGTTGTGGGGASLGGFGGGGFGPGGAGGGGGAIQAAARSYNADMGKKGEAKPQVKMKNPEVSGSLDKRIIQKVVRQHHGELRACYEREVAKIKGLNGVITVVWLISPQGAVTKVILKSSTMKNKNVEKCVTDSIKFWRFPQPRGGGAVQVEYPFDFQVN